MNKDTLDALTMWGDRQNRDTAHLLDIAIAGTIDHLRGHGTVRLLPARLEEIVPRIAPRVRDKDGAWIVTLHPPAADLVAVNPYDVLAYVHHCRGDTEGPGDGADADDILALVAEAAKPGATLRDLGMAGFAYFVEWVGERYNDPIDNQSG